MARAWLRSVGLLLPIAFAAGCGDPLVILGDWPGYMRVVVGIPNTAGFTTDSIATHSGLYLVQGVAAGPDGAFYVSNGLGRIVRVTPDGRARSITPPYGSCSSNCLAKPTGMAVDSAGGLVVADPDAHRIWRLTDAGTAPLAGNGQEGSGADGPALATAIGTPPSVAVDATGLVYFSDRTGNRVRRIDADGTLHTVAGTGAAGFAGDGGPAVAALLNGPSGLAFGGAILYIADAGSQRVRALDTATGVIRTVAGNGAQSFGGDGGPATAAMLSDPEGLTVSADGRFLYIADRLNHRIRVVDLGAGTIQTFAGTGATTFNGSGHAAGETALELPADVAASVFDQLFILDTGHIVVWRTPLGL